MVLVKLGSFMFYRDKIMNLIHFAERNFWNATHGETDTQILEQYDKLGMFLIYTFTFIVTVATFNYIFAPFFGINFRFHLYCTDKCYFLNYHVKRRRAACQIFFFCNRASRKEWNEEDSTLQAVVRFSISLTVLRNHVRYTGNEKEYKVINFV